MIKKRTIFFVILSLMFLGCAVEPGSKDSALDTSSSVQSESFSAAIPVCLQFASRQTYSVSGMTFNWIDLQVKVKNLDFAKKVYMHYQLPSGEWTDFELSFIKHYGSYDIFGSNAAPDNGRFVIKYLINDIVYWDNNAGLDYKLSAFQYVTGNHIALRKAESKEEIIGAVSNTKLSFSIYVDNLSYNKLIGVLYTFDNWNTIHKAFGQYKEIVTEGSPASTGTGVEEWTIDTPSYPGKLNADFCVFYENLDQDKICWDNNFEMNYQIDFEETIE